MQALGAILLAIVGSTTIAFSFVMLFGVVGWFGGYGGMALVLLLGFCVWIAGIVFIARVLLRGSGGYGQDAPPAASNSSLEHSRDPESAQLMRRRAACSPCRLGIAVASQDPPSELYFDLNARMKQNGYLATCNGTLEDLRKLGLTLEQAVGRRFAFAQPDTNDRGELDAWYFTGTIVKDVQFGYIAVPDSRGVIWKSEAV